MPNWCSNSIVVTGKSGIIDLILTKVNLIQFDEDKKDTRVGVFEELIGLGNIDRDKYDGGAWYDHNINRFGTKWDISYEEGSFTFTKDEISFFCETAWSPPIPFLQNLCEMYKVNANLFYSEGGVGFSGETTFTWNDGELDVYDDECGYLEGIYKYSREEFWSEVESRVDSILDEELSLEDFISEFDFVSEEDTLELTRLYNETIENNDEEPEGE